jgi:hypothetical protein
MNKYEKFLIEQGIDDIVIGVGNKRNFIHVSDIIKKYTEEQLSLNGVS